MVESGVVFCFLSSWGVFGVLERFLLSFFVGGFLFVFFVLWAGSWCGGFFSFGFTGFFFIFCGGGGFFLVFFFFCFVGGVFLVFFLVLCGGAGDGTARCASSFCSLVIGLSFPAGVWYFLGLWFFLSLHRSPPPPRPSWCVTLLKEAL